MNEFEDPARCEGHLAGFELQSLEGEATCMEIQIKIEGGVEAEVGIVDK